jgi:N-methylhydantoinase A/oxoprolinase/acetone carboxylase beta subunit
MFFRIGVDVGGTNTDSAILDIRAAKEPSRGVLATCKTSTTSNVTEGITSAIESVIARSKVPRDQILNVAIGTTHFVNATVEGDARRLSRVAVVRLCGPYTKKNPPFSDIPYALREVIEGPHWYLDGGLEIDGREIQALDVEQIRATAAKIYEAGIRSVAVVGVFSALDHEGKHEERCRALMLERFPDLSVVCSHTIGGPGLLARENATILNASILSFARKTMQGFKRAMRKLGLKCPLYITQNDGTLMDAATAALIPVKTFASGPTNSLMGAAFLQGLDLGDKLLADEQIIVVDIGGTTTDVCALLPSGFPRQAANFVEVGGVRTAFSMPEVLSIGLGGGSRVKVDMTTDKVSVGPGSAAHRLTQDAVVFGGNTMTATDIAVGDGSANVGDAKLVAWIPATMIQAAKAEIKRLLETAIDGMKVSAAPVAVLLVGGGSIILTEELAGVSRCLRPPHHDSANAVGAAIAKVAGEVDIIEVLAGRDEHSIVEAAKQRALDAAIANGASREDVQLVDVRKIPLQYVTNKATRLVMKAVGSLTLPEDVATKDIDLSFPPETTGTDDPDDPDEDLAKNDAQNRLFGSMAKPTAGVDLTKYRPDVRDEIWHISPIDVELISVGTGILGTGGGGSSYNMALFVLDILSKGGKITVIPPSSLQDSDICVFGAGYGAPSVSDERIPSGDEVFAAIDGLSTVLGYKDFQGIVADEIGGGNGIVTFPTSAHYKKPVVDCDLMGRAYPTMEHGSKSKYYRSDDTHH